MLGASDSELIINDLLDQILLQDSLELLSGVLLRQLPLAERPMQRVVHGIYAVSGPLLAQLALLEPPLPLIEGLGYDLEVGVAEEQPDDSPVHLALLLVGLLRYVVSDVLLAVPLSA